MLLGANLVAAFLALALPLALFVSRHVVRSQRAALYNDIAATLFPDGGGESWPQLEVVRTKYATGRTGDRSGASFVTDANRDPRTLILTAMFFCAFSFMGFALLLVPFSATSGSAHAWQPLRFLFLADIPLWKSAAVSAPGATQVQLVAAFAFLGAYVTAAQYLIRQLLNYELGAIAFLRAAFQLFLGVVVAVVAFRALVGLAGNLSVIFNGAITTSGIPTTDAGSSGWWLGVAFLIGLAPEAGLSWIADQLKLRLRKRVNLASLDSALIAPLELIDGIDSGIRFRLEESNIFDVQNLATQNPIELCVDTPYGLLQIFDWVLQAQLCTVVGGKAFEALRAHNIRTIFDLERAVLPDDAPTNYVLAIGTVLFANASDSFRTKIGLNGVNDSLTVDVIQHSVGVVSDDLHVHRLRSLWRRILKRSTSDQDRAWLYRRDLLPGDAEELSPITQDGIHWMDHAAFLGRLHGKFVGDLAVLQAAAPVDPAAASTAQAVILDLRNGALAATRRAVEANAAHWTILRQMWSPPPNKPRARKDLASLSEDPDFRTFFNPR
ncbi:MAG: hypothetical protein ACK56C_11220 [Alphaproteobacteria bacterium]